MSDQAVDANEPVQDLDVREAVRRVQEGYEDASPATGVATDELKEASAENE